MRSLILLAFAAAAYAQNPTGFTVVQTNPTGNHCGSNSVALQTPAGNIYTCQNGAYAAVGGGGAPSGPAGTVQIANGSGGFGGDTTVAALTLTSVGTATAPVASAVGANDGMGTYDYYAAWGGAVGFGPTSSVTMFSGNSTLSADNYVKLTTVCPASATQWEAVQSDGNIAHDRWLGVVACGTEIDDLGVANDSYTCAASNLTGGSKPPCTLGAFFNNDDFSIGYQSPQNLGNNGNVVELGNGSLSIYDALGNLGFINAAATNAVPTTGLAPVTEWINSDLPNGYDSGEFMYGANATAAGITITLPPATPSLSALGSGYAAFPGQLYGAVKLDSSANTVTFQVFSGDTILGAGTSIVLSKQGEYAIVEQYFDGGTSINYWLVLSHYVPGYTGSKIVTTCTSVAGGVPTGCTNVTNSYINGILQ